MGGVQGIIQIQTAVQQGLSSRSAAISILDLIYGFTNEQANKILGDVVGEQNNNIK